MKGNKSEPSLVWLIGKKEWDILTERLENLNIGEQSITNRKAAANMLTLALANEAPFTVIESLCYLNQTVLLDATKLFRIARHFNADYRTLIAMQTARQYALLRRYQQQDKVGGTEGEPYNEDEESQDEARRSPPTSKAKSEDFDFDHTANFFRRPNRPVECECCKATFLPARTLAKHDPSDFLFSW